MRSCFWPGFLAISSVAACSAAHADWKGTGEAGFVFTRGNANAETANFKLAMSTERNQWLHSLTLQGLRATGEDTDTGDRLLTAERLTFSWQSDYRFSERAFTFAGLRYDNDRFSGFIYQASLSSGVGYKVIETDETKLSLQIGAGGRQLRSRVSGEIGRDVIVRADANFSRLLTETTQIINRLTVESGADNTQVTDELSLRLRISDAFSLSVGFQLKHNSNPPPPQLQTDKLMTLNLVYSF